jgi:hypothetical protein
MIEFDSDFDALKFLRQYGVREVRNGMLEGPAFKSLGVDQKSAVRYLCEEWDFCYNGLE